MDFDFILISWMSIEEYCDEVDELEFELDFDFDDD